MNITKLRDTAASLFKVAVSAADPQLSVRRELSENPLPIIREGRILLVALGKAATSMAEEALRHIPKGKPCKAVAITNYENARKVEGCEVMASGHPIPDANGTIAAQKVIKLLQSTDKNDIVLMLLSGGGSALLPAPAEGISLQDKIDTNELLLKNGYIIDEINMIRQQLSKIKGGGIQRLAPKSKIRSLIISDVIGDDLNVIASGPTASPIGSRAEAADLLKSRGHWSLLPTPVQEVLSRTEIDTTNIAEELIENSLICSNRQSLLEILRAAEGFDAKILDFNLDGDVAEAAEKIFKGIDNVTCNTSQVLIWGGETTVKLKGHGKGGRNQELALRVAEKLGDLPYDWVFMSAGTDGRDGPTEAAGGLVDGGTIGRLQEKGRSLSSFLDHSDSYNALLLSDDLFITGSTGTNVADVQLFIRWPSYKG